MVSSFFGKGRQDNVDQELGFMSEENCALSKYYFR